MAIENMQTAIDVVVPMPGEPKPLTAADLSPGTIYADRGGRLYVRSTMYPDDRAVRLSGTDSGLCDGSCFVGDIDETRPRRVAKRVQIKVLEWWDEPTG